tara:strand:- start:31 stop:1899 length:1869 start_codon:yes stop_codon:yes gene_type:complete
MTNVNPMSVSMLVDQKNKKQNHYTIQARKPNIWVPNEYSKMCKSCSVAFTIITRKHHCRQCCNIFCNSCTTERRLVNKQSKQRVCDHCAIEIDQTEQNKILILTCLHLPVSFAHFYVLRLVGKQWNYAVNYILSLYRGIQYKLPGDRYTLQEMIFLKVHWHEFNDHSQLIVHAISAFHQFNQPLSLVQYHRQPTPCRLLLCSRTCSPQLSIGGIIQLRHVLYNVQIQRWVVQTWQQMNITTHLNMMFWWLHISLECPRLFREGLVILASHKIELFYALVFECELVKNKKNISLLIAMKKELFGLVPNNWVQDIGNSMVFAKKLRKLSIVFKPASYAGMPPVRLPWNPSELVCGLDVIKQFNSSCKPTVIIITLTNGKKIKCLLKNEDVRSDRLAMVIGYFINNLCTPIVQTYNVFPITCGFGCITMIPDVSTLYAINETTTVLNYILSNNGNENIQTVRGRFIKSCAGACLLAFILGLRDRHLQNILVQKNGVLTHIDFGYILGKDPKYLNTKMRITTGMIDAMGGRLSEGYQRFVELISESYSKIRLHSSLFFHLLSAESHIFKDRKRSTLVIKKHCQAVFFPGLFNETAELLVENIVEESSTETLYTQVCDLFHKFGQHF